MTFRAICLLLIAFACPAAAAPGVVVDIAPTHALVARVMQGVGAPDLLLPPDASPHGYQMRPSDARKLAGADLVVWVGHGLTPWLEKPIIALAGDARALELLEVKAARRLPIREDASAQDHEQGHGHNRGHGHGHGHDEAVDPHAWLDPENAGHWLGAIADALAGLDPGNAAAYRANAAAGAAELKALDREIDAMLAPHRARHFMVMHDGYQYFEQRYRLRSAGSLFASDGAAAGASRLSSLRRRLEARNIACVFAEPQMPERMLDALIGDSGVRRGVLDPLGRDLEPGPSLYPGLLKQMARAIADCLR